MRSYVILRRPKAAPPGRMGLEKLQPKPPEITVENLPDHALRELDADPDTSYAENMPTALIEPLDSPAPAADGTDWGIAAVGADASPFTGAGVTVAVLDTGIDAAHPAFAGVQLVEKDFTGSGNGDIKGHGSHCAGTIFGRDVGGQRIGIARGVGKALIGKVLGNDGKGDSGMIFEALQWALTEKADIVSMSLGFDFPGLVKRLTSEGWDIEPATSMALVGYRSNLRMLDTIMAMLKAHGALGTSPLVVAAGNESKRAAAIPYRIAASLPAAADGVIAVAAIGRDADTYKVAPFSNMLAAVAAPGVDITSAWPGGGLHTISGTSMACPHVSGVAALWWQALEQKGISASAASVGARILASARRNVFAADVLEVDIGQGMVTAPPAN
ncbi:S8 family serine peptidase [Labrys sp. KNU-23]|uniref:S8 family peptidase n=1 Tax=Labrys sp. KNU-23 TaxID=2789216 RepID=UPI0011EE1311|nr:S8 family serine peptidase [Labrys sp. KNU-23]QEN87524.1 S8 family serine peptidase [Labrys sp. KNU-23]